MKRSLLFGSLLLFGVSPSISQTFTNYSISPAYAIRGYVPMDMGGGNTAYACDHAFGYDSARVDLMFTAPDQGVTASTSYRLSSPLLTSFWHAAKLDDGILVSGSSTLPMLCMTDNTGVLQWYAGFDNLQGDQGIVARIVPRGNAFTVYTGQGGAATHDIYRIEGESTGTTFTATKISAAAYMRVFVATATAADPLVQFAAGEGLDDADFTHQKAMLMKTDASGASWFKFYDMGTASNQEIYGIRPLADGNYLCSGYYTGTGVTGFEGMLLKVDASGTVIWCRKYSDVTAGLFLDHTYELGSGELLVAGFNANYQGILSKLASDGTPIWTKIYALDRLHDFFTSGTQLKVTGPASLLELDANGESCDLTPATNITSVPYVPVVTSIAVTNTSFAPSTTALTYASRTPVLSWAEQCTFTGIDEAIIASNVLHPYPDPTNGMVMLAEPGSIAPSERIIVRSVTGALVHDGAYAEGIDLGPLTSGIYTVEIVRTHQHVRVMRE